MKDFRDNSLIVDISSGDEGLVVKVQKLTEMKNDFPKFVVDLLEEEKVIGEGLYSSKTFKDPEHDNKDFFCMVLKDITIDEEDVIVRLSDAIKEYMQNSLGVSLRAETESVSKADAHKHLQVKKITHGEIEELKELKKKAEGVEEVKDSPEPENKKEANDRMSSILKAMSSDLELSGKNKDVRDALLLKKKAYFNIDNDAPDYVQDLKMCPSITLELLRSVLMNCYETIVTLNLKLKHTVNKSYKREIMTEIKDSKEMLGIVEGELELVAHYAKGCGQCPVRSKCQYKK